MEMRKKEEEEKEQQREALLFTQNQKKERRWKSLGWLDYEGQFLLLCMQTQGLKGIFGNSPFDGNGLEYELGWVQHGGDVGKMLDVMHIKAH